MCVRATPLLFRLLSHRDQLGLASWNRLAERIFVKSLEILVSLLSFTLLLGTLATEESTLNMKGWGGAGKV